MGSEGLFWLRRIACAQGPYWIRVVLFLGLPCRRHRSDGRDGVSLPLTPLARTRWWMADAWSKEFTQDVKSLDMRVRVRVRVHSWVVEAAGAV